MRGLRVTFTFSPLFLQLWLPTVQLVLQADWQLDWHSPQPILPSLRIVF